MGAWNEREGSLMAPKVLRTVRKIRVRDVHPISRSEFDLSRVWQRPRDLHPKCKVPGCRDATWPSFDGVCFLHGMYPETIPR